LICQVSKLKSGPPKKSGGKKRDANGRRRKKEENSWFGGPGFWGEKGAFPVEFFTGVEGLLGEKPQKWLPEQVGEDGGKQENPSQFLKGGVGVFYKGRKGAIPP